MNKCKMLLTGKQSVIIDDFFKYLSSDFDILTTSYRCEDMINHINFFKPDVFFICLNGETEEDIARLVEVKRTLTREDIMVLVSGSKKDCDAFEKAAVYMADKCFERPISLDSVKTVIFDYMQEKEKRAAEQAALMEKLEKLKETDERKRVLIVDDDPIMLRVVKEHLHDKYDVATAISGKIAYRYLESKSVDLILLDYQMPEEDGPSVLRTLRQKFDVENIPVLFLTGVTEKEKVSEVLALKPQGYLIKPIDKDKLIGTIEKFIG
ncbi:MAG: response regulator [Lachnospiraceae bacterium]|nr:response regulator [Lachnospiraceae bacterium]